MFVGNKKVDKTDIEALMQEVQDLPSSPMAVPLEEMEKAKEAVQPINKDLNDIVNDQPHSFDDHDKPKGRGR